jgi:hypothetical protein
MKKKKEISYHEAQLAIVKASVEACKKINVFSKEVLHTRGGRIGSGMGTLLEALWGYFTNHGLSKGIGLNRFCELAWMYGHEYNDFALVINEQEWNPISRKGEILRIEIKSMVTSADESKAHFDQIKRQLTEFDLLAVLVWDWIFLDDIRVCPQILDHFIGPALPIAHLRDSLHESRGGTFVDSQNCPDGCDPQSCKHTGEPLNEQGKRERISGPESRRVSEKVSYAANFGGMVRMLKTDSESAREVFRKLRREDEIAQAYISFIHRNFPKEELNQYTVAEWRRLGLLLNIQSLEGLRKEEVVKKIRESRPDYQNQLRDLKRKVEKPETKLEEVYQSDIPHVNNPSKAPCTPEASSQLSSELYADDLQKLLRQIRDGVDRS